MNLLLLIAHHCWQFSLRSGHRWPHGWGTGQVKLTTLPNDFRSSSAYLNHGFYRADKLRRFQQGGSTLIWTTPGE